MGNGITGFSREPKDHAPARADRPKSRVLTTVVSYPERGPYGDNNFRGNCSGLLVEDLCVHYAPLSMLDPMVGGGTSRDVAETLGIDFEGYDLANGMHEDVFARPWGDRRFDLVFAHPPYGPMIRYGESDQDLSTLSIPKFKEALVAMADLLFEEAVADGGHLAILIGTLRKNGRIHAFARDLVAWREPSEPEIVKIQHNVTSPSSRTGQLYGNRFIPILDERVLIWKK